MTVNLSHHVSSAIFLVLVTGICDICTYLFLFINFYLIVVGGTLLVLVTPVVAPVTVVDDRVDVEDFVV